MGGRGASSGISHKGDVYGTEFTTLLHFGNIKFVRYRHATSAKIPYETMSAAGNRVYVLINKQDEISSISFYNKEGKLRRQIHFGHAAHHGFSPHIHKGYEHSQNAHKPDKSDEAYIKKARRLWSAR